MRIEVCPRRFFRLVRFPFAHREQRPSPAAPAALATLVLLSAGFAPGLGDLRAAEEPARAKPRASAPASSPLPTGVMFRINGKDVPRAQFLDELEEALGDTFREPFISHVLLDQKARAEGVEVANAETEEFVQTSVDQVQKMSFEGDLKRLEEALREQGLTLEGWKRRLRIDGRYDLLAERLIRKERTITEDQIKRAFEDKHGKDGVTIRVRHLLRNVAVAASTDYTTEQYEKEKARIDEEAHLRAEEALRRLRSGESWESVSNDLSDDPRKHVAGLLGAWKGRFGPEFDEAAGKLAKEEISGIIKSADGYRIVHCVSSVNNDEVHALHILVATGGKAKGRTAEESKKKAEDLLARIKAGDDFAKLAKENSDDAGSAQRGGDLGFFGRKAMVKQFEEVAYALEPGKVSEVVKTAFGYHIIKVLEKRTSEERTLRQIFVSTAFAAVKDRRVRPALEDRIRAELESTIEDLSKPGASFAEIAKARSDDAATKEDGGLLKNYKEGGTYGSEFDQTVKTMNAGDPPRIVKDSQGNLHLVLVDSIVKTDLEDVRSALHDELMQRPASKQEKSDYIKKLRDAASIVP